LGVDAELARVAASQGGVFFSRQAYDSGYVEREVAAKVRHREWIRIRRGAFASRALVETLDAAGRHVLAVRAVVGALSGDVVITGYSALALMGVPLWGVDLDLVHVHRDAGKSSRREAGVAHHLGTLPLSEVQTVDGLLVCVPERSLVDALRQTSFEAGTVLADGTRRVLGADVDQAKDIVERQRDWSGSVKASRVLTFSNPLAATVGESRGRVLLARVGLPPPVLQRQICDSRGKQLGIADFYLDEYDVAAEFDGKMKYGRQLYQRPGLSEDVDLGHVVWAEKRREDAIRDQGIEIVRFVWSELDGHDGVVRARFLRAVDRARRRRGAA
jgi:hypothetical protein